MIGVLMLISIFVAAAGILAVTYFSTPAPDKIPAVDVVATNQSRLITLYNAGGDALSANQLQILVDGTAEPFTGFGSDNTWSIGETLSYTVSDSAPMPSSIEVVYNQSPSVGTGSYVLSSILLGSQTSVPQDITLYTITASAGTGGSISPSGTVRIPSGTSATFTITPMSGYSILSVTVDGSSAGAVTSYAFSNVVSSHTISVTFKPPMPTFISISPTSGPVTGVTSVSITGTNLTGTTLVTFGGNPATNLTIVSSTSITASTPPGSAGAADVAIIAPNGTATGTGAYAYGAIPTISSISPLSGLLGSGTLVNITGTNLVGANSGGSNGVTFGGTAATINANTATTINMSAPAGSNPVTVTVTVVTPNGTVTTSYNYFMIQIFTSSTTWTAPTGVSGIQYLVVGGGGGGGGDSGGGGGAGAVWNGTLTTGLTGSKTVTVGSGGAAGTTGSGAVGKNSVFGNGGTAITATGGGLGAGGNAKTNGGTGGSGGGATGTGNGGTGVSGHGYAGGSGTSWSSSGTKYLGGGGGGAMAAGGAATGSAVPYSGGIGGAGEDFSSLFGTGFGVSGVVAGGGGGGGSNNGLSTAGSGGAGGGGSGSVSGAGTAGTANTGGGGGGGNTTSIGGAGGSGIVVIKYY
jgi:hypothetical protein